ncbi:hypothetical protein [Tomitella biformata]|uniref:hypothetical protein n=1 Tax=Tomitella biformata TaxID=630403 RepID=UPI0004AEAA2B|nr:hypothetical protein [Tomitella biformata]
MGKKKRKGPRPQNTRANPRARGADAMTHEQAQELLGTPMFPIVSGHAGLAAMDRPKRLEFLRQFNLASALQPLVSIQSQLDVAATTDWTEGAVERRLLTEADPSWVTLLDDKVGRTHRLIPPRSMTQLMREVLELGHTEPDGGDISVAAALELIMSITTEQLADSSPLDADPDPDPAELQRLMAEIASYTPEQSILANRELALSELANLQSNAPVKLELILASTFDLWFQPWPERVTDARVGDTPASAFELANGVALLDVMVVGQILTERVLAGNYDSTRDDLLADGAVEEAVEFVYENMSYTISGFRTRLEKDRSRGPVLDQRYVFTERPFVAQENGNLSALRYQWVIDRFFGAQLYWQTFFAFGRPTKGSTAEAFSQAMNYAFERTVGDALEQIASRSQKITRVVTEPEMQEEWAERRGAPPSVCDFVLVAGRACFLLDATNHHLGANLAQGIASVEEFNKDIEEAFVAKKFEQLVATAKKIRETTSFGIDANPVFYPFVVVPDNGLSSITSVQFDWRQRAVEPFRDLQGSTNAPVPISISELSLIEGLAERYSPGRDIADFIGWWLALPMPLSLRQLVDKAKLLAPIPKRMLRNQETLTKMIRDHRNSPRRDNPSRSQPSMS